MDADQYNGVAAVVIIGLGILLIIGLLFLHFLPTYIAHKRDHEHVGLVFLVNLVAGWTVLFWLAALVWAMLGRTKAESGRTVDPGLGLGPVPSQAQQRFTSPPPTRHEPRFSPILDRSSASLAERFVNDPQAKGHEAPYFGEEVWQRDNVEFEVRFADGSRAHLSHNVWAVGPHPMAPRSL